MSRYLHHSPKPREHSVVSSSSSCLIRHETISTLSMGSERDKALVANPLEVNWILRCLSSPFSACLVCLSSLGSHWCTQTYTSFFRINLHLVYPTLLSLKCVCPFCFLPSFHSFHISCFFPSVPHLLSVPVSSSLSPSISIQTKPHFSSLSLVNSLSLSFPLYLSLPKFICLFSVFSTTDPCHPQHPFP